MPEVENTPSNPQDENQESHEVNTPVEALSDGVTGGELPETVTDPKAENASEMITEEGGEDVSNDVGSETEPEVLDTQNSGEVQSSQPVADVLSNEDAQIEPDLSNVNPTDEVDASTPAAENVVSESTEQESGDGTADTPAEQEATPDPVEVASNLMAEILGDEANFETVVTKSNPNELALLLDNIASNGDVGTFISKVGMIKRAFDEKTNPETIDHGLLIRFNTSLARFNKKRTAYYAEREKEKEENSQKKYALLEQLKVIVKEEQVTKIQEVRNIQQQWRETGWVLQKDLQALNETYRQYLDVFYTLRSKYQELLDLDRRYNKEEKRKIIGVIEGLIPKEEGTTREVWNDHSAKVKSLQDVWRTVGHVPREDVDQVNKDYRDVLDRFYEMRSGYYELQDAQKAENSEKKKELLETLQGYAEFSSDKARDWNDATKRILAVQEEWKKIGPGPIEVNKQLWKDYRSVCDKFFERKGAYFKSFDEERTENLKQKIAICESAEALQESEEWRDTAKALKDMQEAWKAIGPVHERHSNKVWKRFRKACDHFFERRSKASSADRQAYNENLKIKEGLIARLKALAESENPADGIEEFQEIQTSWKATGHVPYKIKDKVNNAFKEAIGIYYKKSRLGRGEIQSMRMESSINSIGDEDARSRKINGEIRKTRGRLRGMEEKVAQYEINIQYISKGKSGKSLRDQIQKQIDDEKDRIAQLKKKVKDLRHLLDNPPVPEAEAPEKVKAPAAEKVVEENDAKVESNSNAETDAEKPEPPNDEEKTPKESNEEE